MKEIVAGLNRCWEDQSRAVIATIINVDGSAYRREGACCLVYETGEVEGILSGGCLENDLAEHACDVFRTHQPQKISYDFRWETDDIWGLGLGCNGFIDVWLQPFDPVEKRLEAESMLQAYHRRLSCDAPYMVACVIESDDSAKFSPGMQWSLNRDEEKRFESLGKQAGLMKVISDGIEVDLFVEKIVPSPKLYIFGSGHDAALLAKKAKEVEWRVSMIDHRSHFAKAMHFPDVDDYFLIQRGEYSSVPIPDDAFAVVMTHNLDLDRLAVRTLLPLQIPYLGVLGSQQRIIKILESIVNFGMPILDRWMNKVHSPVGLDIGATTPEEITISIMAELIACNHGRTGGFIHRDSCYERKVTRRVE